MLHFLETHHRPVLVLLTKSDKLSRSESAKVLARVRAELAPNRHVRVELFSATAGTGVEIARGAIAAWLEK
jgi:GTP-binding protein